MRTCPHCGVEHDETKPRVIRLHEERCARRRFSVTCGCGWSLLDVKEDDIPPRCPECGYNLRDHAAGLREENEGKTLDFHDFNEG